MFQLEIEVIGHGFGSVGFVKVNGEYRHPFKPTTSPLTGPVGIHAARQRLEYMSEVWATQAHMWPCGRQDGYGDCMDHARQELAELTCEAYVEWTEDQFRAWMREEDLAYA